MPTINVQAIIDRKKALEEQKKNTLPTPPVGTLIVWYDRAIVEDDRAYAAIVTRVDGPGKITPIIFPPASMPIHRKQGSLHVSDPIHQKRGNASSVNCGAWDYPKGTNRPKAHSELHLSILDRKIETLEQQIEEARQHNMKAEAETSTA